MNKLDNENKPGRCLAAEVYPMTSFFDLLSLKPLTWSGRYVVGDKWLLCVQCRLHPGAVCGNTQMCN